MAQLHFISDAADRVMAAQVSGLEIAFGRSAGAALAARFLDAEEVDFQWIACTWERRLGNYRGDEEADIEVDRVQVIGRIDRRWFVVLMLFYGNGDAVGVLGKRCFGSARQGRWAFANA